MLPATGAKSSRAQAPQTLAAQGFLANAEKVQFPALTAAKMGPFMAGIKRRAAKFPPVEVGEVGEGVARGSPGTVLLPSCPPALLPYSGHTPKRAAGAAPPRMSSRAKGKADISVSVQKTPVKE